MLRISVDGTTRTTASGPENWGDLLNLLEEGDGGMRRVVTAVRFDGVDVPTFREPFVLARALEKIGPIDVETSTVDDLLHVSASAAFDSIQPLRSAATRMAARLRAGEGAAGARHLPGLVATVRRLAALTEGLARTTHAAEPHRHDDFDALVQRLRRLADDLLALHTQEDWPGVTALIERDLVHTFDAWVLVARRGWSLTRS